MSSTIDCPYCKHEHEPIGNREDKNNRDCLGCDKEFMVHVNYDPDYCTSKMSCVGDHKWVGIDLNGTWMKCSECNVVRGKWGKRK